MITAEIIQQTEARFAQRQPIRLEREAKINSGRILEADTPERVKSRLQHLATRAVVIEGVGLPAPGQPATTTADLERILGKNDLMSVRYLEIGLRIARTVGRIHIRSADGNRVRHRVPGVAEAADDQQPCPRKRPDRRHEPCRVQFPGRPRRELAAHRFSSTSTRRPSSSPTGRSISAWSHSKATSATSASSDGTGCRRRRASLSSASMSRSSSTRAASASRLALRENRLIDLTDEGFLQYTADTLQGSSGSPVFSTAWELVGLHHSGVPETHDGKIVSVDGTEWNEDMGDDKIHWIANEGARISKILRHIQGLSLSGPQATLRQQLLQSEKGWTGGREFTEQITVEGVEAGRGPNSWTLPLQLTIDVSGGTAGLSIGGRSTEAGAAPARHQWQRRRACRFGGRDGQCLARLRDRYLHAGGRGAAGCRGPGIATAGRDRG